MKKLLFMLFIGILLLPSTIYAYVDYEWRETIWKVAPFIIIVVCVYISTLIKRRKERARTIWRYWALVHNTNTFLCKIDSVRRNKNKITVDVSECRYLGSLLKRYEVAIKNICWDETMNRIDIFVRKKAKIKKGEYLVISGTFFERYMEQGENYYYNSILRIEDYRYVMEILPRDTKSVCDNVEKGFKKIEYLFGRDVAETLRLITYFDNEEQYDAFCQVKGIRKKRKLESQKREYFDELKKLRENQLI